ncbi:MAG: MBOAT family O-acyltransferase [Erysipelotrichaceae bacterium]
MLFSSMTYLLLFFPIFIFLYFLNKNVHYRNTILLLASLTFYAWGEVTTLPYMFIIAIVNYALTRELDKTEDKKRLLFVWILVILNILPLAYFKYSNFFLDNINIVLNTNFTINEAFLPLGISFYTFRNISYIIDVYRKKFPAEKSFLIVLNYILLFPTLISGPIVRFETIREEYHERKITVDDVVEGLERFIIGLAKKVLIANQVAVIAANVFSITDLNSLNSTQVYIAVISFTLQIYFDFSGYSDMAIGIGRIFGFHFLENFNYPYIATSITDFWKRWHISLSTWFRDYIYIPLGGNRVSMLRWILNIAIVWFTTGLWHGAAWNFVLWGVYFGVLLVLEKLFLGKILSFLKGVNHLIVIFLIMISWVIFNSHSVDQIMIFVQRMIFIQPYDMNTLVELNFGNYWPFYVLGLLFSAPIIPWLDTQCKTSTIYNFAKKLIVLALFILCIIFLIDSSYNPFIYFKF